MSSAAQRTNCARLECAARPRCANRSEVGKMATSAAINGSEGISVGAAFGNGFELLGRRTAEITVTALLLGAVPGVVLEAVSQHVMTRLSLSVLQKAGVSLLAAIVVGVLATTAALALI